jgi:nucleoid DNA-binding protein
VKVFSSKGLEDSLKKGLHRGGRDLATGEDLTLDPRRVIVSKCASAMREEINGKGEQL